LNFFRINLKYHSLHRAIWQTQAAAELTHALLNLQPAGLFCQVGDEQAIALRKLATIFEASKPNKVNKKLTPQNAVENNAPQRVQTTVSPPRVDTQNPV
jgi:hypothetical protein